jgi:predicted Zn-dependent protease
MKKAAAEGFVILVVFFSAWFVLKQINWVSLFRIDTKKEKLEEQLGEILLKTFKDQNKENTDQVIFNSVDSIVTKICFDNNIEKKNLKIHIINNDEINAFALPDGHLVIYSGIISAVERQEELCGVICHEIAHIELNHVMKKLIRDIGLNVLLSMTTNGGSDMARRAAGLLSSTAYDRNLEREADLKAVDYLITSDIDPRPFAEFLFNITENRNEKEYLTWVSTHPDAEERSKEILKYADENEFTNKPVLCASTWNLIRSKK